MATAKRKASAKRTPRGKQKRAPKVAKSSRAKSQAGKSNAGRAKVGRASIGKAGAGKAKAGKAKAGKGKAGKGKAGKAKIALRPVRSIRAVRLPTALLLTAALESVTLEAAGGRVEALQSKLDAIERLEEALRARRTNTPADDDLINPNIDALTNEKRAVEAEIVAAETQTLDPPSETDVLALRNAIRDAEDAIAKNTAVNQLIKAATALARTLSA
jgi:hypothetical protein